MKDTKTVRASLSFYLISLLLISISLQAASSTERDKFLYFNDIDGLPRNIITSIEQDKYGYTWIGTGNGISRFDGNSFINYDQLKGQTINQLLIDSKNNLWVVCEEGLYLYNRINDHFEMKYVGIINTVSEYADKIYLGSFNKIMEMRADGIYDIIRQQDILTFCITDEGFWLGTNSNGVLFVSHKNLNNTENKTLLKGKSVPVIRNIEENIFFGCSDGEVLVQKPNGTLSKIVIENHHAIKEIIEVNDETWLATDGNGIIILDQELNYSRSLNRELGENPKLKSNSIYDIYWGHDNEVWIATYGAGLICLRDDNSPFKNIIPEPGNPNSLVAKEGVLAFQKDNRIFLGTNYGLSVLEERTGKFTNIPMRRLKNELNGSKVLAVNTDKNNNLWIGTYDGLLGKYTSDLKLIRTYQPCGDKATDMQRITFIHKCGENNLLIGTHYRNRKLLNFDLKTEKATPFLLSNSENGRTNFNLMSLRENPEGEIIALLKNRGLYTVNQKENLLENTFPEINNRITSGLFDFYQDKKGYFWLATQSQGLIKISEDGREFDQWTTKQGLPGNTLLRIESTDDEYLWISTISGICRFEKETENILVFNHKHGLAGNEFIARASTATNDGRIIFGSNAGFTIVDPKKVQPDNSETEVIISDITFQNQSIKHITDKPLLTSPIEETREIHLPFNRNSFTIHFFSKDENLPKYNNYAYRLEGLEDTWIYLGETKHTTYTNLSPGKYIFEVKSTNNSNVWSNESTHLTIHINPPWHLSWWAFTLYAILSISFIMGALYIHTSRVQLKKEVEMSEYKARKEIELTERKLAFFTNVSHDFKTPLTLISAPLGDLMNAENLNKEQQAKLQVIYKNSGRLYKLICDLLDFRKLTGKQISLSVRKTNIKELVENTCEAFKEEFKAKKIGFECRIENMDEIFVDPRKIEKILWNLLSNAIKFTPENGKISLNVEGVKMSKKHYLQITVKDTGTGISPNNREKVFDRFYQASDKNKNSSEGTGIGLSIVKDLVELHHGNIELTSAIGAGSTFVISVPCNQESYFNHEIECCSKKEEIPYTQTQSEELNLQKPKKLTRYNLPKILLTEDNIELLNYLTGHFEKNYNVYNATDGEKGFKLVKEKNPDIIITDLLMPNMDGYEFCKKIKQQFETSHIPVVILTANNTVEQQIEGLELGADAYISKPFNIQLLDTTILSILETRKKIRERIMGVSETTVQNNKLTKKDIEFIENLKSCIETNLENHKLNVDFLSAHIGISKPQLTRKVKSLTSQTPNNLIKSIRLKKAYDLIKNEGLRVSEASDKTGFSDPNYFTICFSKEFGKNPSKI